MVDEPITSDPDLKTNLSHPTAVVVIFEHPDAESVVKTPDSIPNRATQCHTEERDVGNIGALARMIEPLPETDTEKLPERFRINW